MAQTLCGNPTTFKTDIAIIGAGAAGLAAAVSAYDAGVHDIMVFEREDAPGGILKQCIHNGFGLQRYKEELSGPEYAHREYAAALQRGININYAATVLSIEPNTTLRVLSPEFGLAHVEAKAIILAMGSRERTRGALRIPGTRPAGVYTAGTVQRLINLQGIVPGKEVVMLGSGDIGLIVARRLVYEGAHVKMVLNRSHFSGGLRRNIVQCLDDYGIPLRLLQTVTNVYGRDRIEAVGVSEVDKPTKQAIPGTEERVSCDMLVLSVGLIPENDLSRAAGISLDRGSQGAIVNEQYQTSVPGIFSCGNVLHVHDLVDFVSDEGERAGRSAAAYVQNEGAPEQQTATTRIVPGNGVGYVVPQLVTPAAHDDLLLRFRVRDIYHKPTISVKVDGETVKTFKRPILIPAEMVEIHLNAQLLAGHATAEIHIEAGQNS
ncbi:MAG: FAD-dependent oxidoreductase [Coriobacteriales bacterium]|nr:FAD-dependent oxidoreductase [Coriobacteriales bacterium]